MKRSLLYGIGLCVVGAIALVSVPVAQAISTGGVGGRPANPDPNEPRSQSIFIYTLERGQTKSDQVLVTNNSDREQTLDVYAVDGVVTNTGAYTCRQKVEQRSSVGSWIELKDTSLTLAPGAEQRVDFTLTMPQQADAGEHNGCIVFEPKTDAPQGSGGVQIQTRQALRVVATIPGELRRDVSIEGFTVDSRLSAQDFTLSVKNVGNVSADVDMRVGLKDMFGNVWYGNGGEYPVLANQQMVQNFENTAPPLLGGWYEIQASIAYDTRPGKFGTTDEANLVTKYTDKKTIFLWPTLTGWLMIIGVVALLMVALFWWHVRRRARKQLLQDWHAVTMKRDSNIEEIAERYAIPWRQIARVNKISAPYNLRAGQKILLPSSINKHEEPINET